MLRLVSDSPTPQLQREVDPSAQDEEGCTPLMRACLHGREDAALALYRWHAAALKVRNYDGESCLELAAPHESLCAELARLEKIRKLSEASRSAAEREHRARGGGSGSSGSRGGSSGEFLKPAAAGLTTRKPCRTASLDEHLNPPGHFGFGGSSSSSSSTSGHGSNAPLRSASSSSCTMGMGAPPSTSPVNPPLTPQPAAAAAGHAAASAATKLRLRTSSPASMTRAFRAASPSVQQPLTVSVDDVVQPHNTAASGVLYARRRRSSATGGLSKRSSFDSGINILQYQHQQHEKKDSKTVPK